MDYFDDFKVLLKGNKIIEIVKFKFIILKLSYDGDIEYIWWKIFVIVIYIISI